MSNADWLLVKKLMPVFNIKESGASSANTAAAVAASSGASNSKPSAPAKGGKK